MRVPHERLVSTAVLEQSLFEVKRVVVGQDLMVERMMVGLLARGHVLLEGVPGVAKTLAVKTLADVVGYPLAGLFVLAIGSALPVAF